MEKGELEIFDYIEAAFIHAQAIPFRAQSIPGGEMKVKFVFPDDDAVRRAIEAFKSNAPVRIQDFISATEAVKDSFMSIKRAVKYGRRVPERQIIMGDQRRKS